MAGFPFVYPV